MKNSHKFSCICLMAVSLLFSGPASADDSEAFQLDIKDFKIDGDLKRFKASWKVAELEEGLKVFTLSLKADKAETPPEFSVKWQVPSVNIYGQWTPNISLDKATFWKSIDSRAVRYAPVTSFFDISENNRMTVACSEALRSMKMNSYLREEDSCFYTTLTFFPEKTPAIDSYQVHIRVDTRNLPVVDSLRQVGLWWAEFKEFTPSSVPEFAKRPMYSTWYSYHQNITVKEIVEECRLSKKVGFESVIVDDGWQTNDSNRGYAYTGDWRPVRIGNMKDFVQQVHDLDMKFLLWYSVSLVGEKSENFEKFKGKYLWYWQGQNAWVLDPRFPDVREFIINTYVTALKEWQLDGFKLDFMGMFRPDEKTKFEAIDGRDFASIDKAVDRLMTDIMVRLRSIRPDIMIEFRQPYIGPLMRKYGNMFRAADCPNMALVNRARTTDIRLICGDTAVHSDMYVWHPEDTVESAALQILSVLFTVPQLSVKMDKVPEDHKQMIRFWTTYWNDNRDILLDGDFRPQGFTENYDLISSSKGAKLITAIYGERPVKLPARFKAFDLVNAKLSNDIYLDIESNRTAVVRTFTTNGKKVSEKKMTLAKGVVKMSAPSSGLLTISEK